MAWSKWRGACVLTLLASVGLAWSQSPMFNRTATSSERIMTVHENGKELRCRLVQSWKTSTGAQAHQLQVIETGELMTIVEDGSPTTVPGSQARALPMRIFHWGQRERMSPAGAPLPPQTIESVAATTASPTIQTTSSQTVTSMPTTTSSACDGVITGPAPRIIGSSKERIVSWDERTGKPITVYPSATAQTSGPVIIDGGTIVESPRQGLLPRLFGPKTESVVVQQNATQPAGVKTVSGNTSPTIIGETKSDTKVLPTSTVESKSDAKAPLTLREKMANMFHKPAVTKPADPKPVEAKKDDKTPTELPAQAGKKSSTAKKDEKLPFSTATAQTTATPKTAPLAIPTGAELAKKESISESKTEPKAPAVPDAVSKDAPKKDGFDWRKMWGKQPDSKVEQPGQATVDREKVRKDLPPASQTERKKQDILMAPEKFNPGSEKVNPKVPAELVNLPVQQQSFAPLPTPLGVQSVLSARNGAQGPVQYIPVPVATVPEPIRPPTPPAPKLPEPPNPTAYLNAFSPPPAQNQQPLTPEQMQVIMQHQALMQQQAYLQQQTMLQRMQNGQTAQLVPVGYGMPMQVNYPAVYGGPQAPNPIAQQQPMSPIQQVGFVPQAGGVVNAMDRRVVPAVAQQPALSDSNTLAQVINVLQESPYPAQREWAAANLSTFDCRVYPHLTQVLVQAARQDAVATVRAAAIYSLSRMNMQSEPVLGTLHALRGDADPRVRQEVEQAYVRMGLTPTQP